MPFSLDLIMAVRLELSSEKKKLLMNRDVKSLMFEVQDQALLIFRS